MLLNTIFLSFDSGLNFWATLYSLTLRCTVGRVIVGWTLQHLVHCMYCIIVYILKIQNLAAKSNKPYHCGYYKYYHANEIRFICQIKYYVWRGQRNIGNACKTEL